MPAKNYILGMVLHISYLQCCDSKKKVDTNIAPHFNLHDKTQLVGGKNTHEKYSCAINSNVMT